MMPPEKQAMFLESLLPVGRGWTAPEKQDAQVVGNQRNHPVLFLWSLPRLGGGWSANTALASNADCPA
jgi:hypothetical protein